MRRSVEKHRYNAGHRGRAFVVPELDRHRGRRSALSPRAGASERAALQVVGFGSCPSAGRRGLLGGSCSLSWCSTSVIRTRTLARLYLYIGRVVFVKRSRRPSSQTVQVLVVLAADPARWRHGYELGVELGLASGSLYPILVRLSDRGLLEAVWEADPPSGRPPRHLYRLTAPGRDYAATHAATSRAASWSQSALRSAV
jgi:DNA-binding PadR family transcriptional regulator